MVDLSTSSTGEVIQGRQVTDLPLGQRNFLELATLTPGVTQGAYGSDASGINQNVETMRYADSGGAALTVNGLRPQSNNFLLDGTDNNESLVNTIVFFPSPDAIQEFRVTTSVAPAEFGRAGGAIVNTSIKSGTNQIHGTAFGYFRDQVFDANPQCTSPDADSAGLPAQAVRLCGRRTDSARQAFSLWRLPGAEAEAAAGCGLPDSANRADAAG